MKNKTEFGHHAPMPAPKARRAHCFLPLSSSHKAITGILKPSERSRSQSRSGSICCHPKCQKWLRDHAASYRAIRVIR